MRLGCAGWMRNVIGGAAAALGVTATAVAAQQAPQRPPNIVVILADDLGYGDLSCYGSTTISTPNLDQMAREGVRFTDFYAPAPVCSPTRAALLTGRYPLRAGVPAASVFFPDSKTGLPPEQLTIAEVLKSRGYATTCIGKWHLGHLPKFLPTAQGFDSFFGLPYSNDMHRAQRNDPPVPLMRDGKIVEQPADQSTLTKRYTEEAVKFIETNAERPFFLYLPHTFPHVPLAASDAFRGKSKAGLYGDCVEEIDWSTGQILQALRRLKLDENTLVVFTSDNGPWLKQGKDGGSSGPLRDGKGTIFEGGMRVPGIMRWTGRIPAGSTCRELATIMDLLPTAARLSGAELKAHHVLDGKDILPLLESPASAKSPYEAFFYHNRQGLNAVRSGKWKLHLNGGALHDLESDIGERTDVSDQNPEAVQRLRKLAEDFRATLPTTAPHQ